MKMLRNNLGLKILSLLIAIGLWFYVLQVQSPDMERTIRDVPVVFTQRSLLEEKGLILLNDNEHTIDVTIRGQRKYVMEVNATNLNVLADVSAIDSTGTHVVYPNIVMPFGNIEILDRNPSAITVEVDNLVTEQFPVTANIIGEPAQNFVVEETRITPDSINITGPKSLVDGIQRVTADVDVSGRDADVATVVPITLWGTADKEIESTYITTDFTEVEIRCSILKTKEVNLAIAYTEDFNIGSDVVYTPDSSNLKTVTIAGAPEVIDDLESVSTVPISPDDISESGEATVRLQLPDGVQSMDGEEFLLRFTRSIVPAE